jgi:hypothetical protein
MPGVGSYCFRSGTEEVSAHPEPGVDRETVEDAFRRAVLPLAIQMLGREVLHASAVLGPRGVVALCAVSETGKSTLAYGLSRRGFRLWADDAVAFELAADGVSALPLPFALRLRPASVAFFGTAAHELEEPDRPEDLAAILVLERAELLPERAVLVERFADGLAFPAVLAHAYCFSLDDDERKRRMMGAYMELVGRVPVYRVRFRPGLDRLGRVVDALDAAVRA